MSILEEREYFDVISDFWARWKNRKAVYSSLAKWWEDGKSKIKGITSLIAAGCPDNRAKQFSQWNGPLLSRQLNPFYSIFQPPLTVVPILNFSRPVVKTLSLLIEYNTGHIEKKQKPASRQSVCLKLRRQMTMLPKQSWKIKHSKNRALQMFCLN